MRGASHAALSYPHAASSEEQRQISEALAIILRTLIVASLLVLALPLLLPGYLARAMVVVLSVDSLCFTLLILNRRGFTRIASVALVVGLLGRYDGNDPDRRRDQFGRTLFI